MRSILLFTALGVAAIALGVVLRSPLARGAKKAQEPIPAAEAQVQGELTLDQLQHFPGLPVYWLGDEYNGLKLVKIQYVRDPGPPGVGRPAVEYVGVIYASCKPGHPAGGGSTEGYCREGERPTFVSVDSDRFCLNQPSFLVDGARRGPPFTVGGARAQRTDSGNIHLYTGESTVIVFSSEGEGATEEAARKLKGANALARRLDSATLGAPMREEDCEGFVLPEPVAIPTAIPVATPAVEPTPTPTLEQAISEETQ